MRGRALLALTMAAAMSGGMIPDAHGEGLSTVTGTSPTTGGPLQPLAGISARCWRFDDLPPGSALTIYRGVTFRSTGGPLRVKENIPGPPFSAPNSILPEKLNEGTFTTAAPPGLVRGAKVTMGDYDADEDTIHLVAYDSFGNEVASDTEVVPQSLLGGVWLEVDSDSANIRVVKFWGDNGNTVYFDNVCFLK